MPIPAAVAVFCITAATCQERKRRIDGDQFISSQLCGFVEQESHPFTVGAVDMSQFIHSRIEELPAVKSVLVKDENGRVQVEVAVDTFEWEYLQPIYEMELYLSDVFRGRALDFLVIDESPNAGQAAIAGGPR